MPSDRKLDSRVIDALLSGRTVADEPELSALIGQVKRVASGPPAEPSVALAALLADGFPALPVADGPVAPAPAWWAVLRGRGLQLSLSGAAGFALVLGAAATDTLPAPAQNAVANVVEAVTPLTLPRPGDDDPLPAPSPTPSPTTTPAADAGLVPVSPDLDSSGRPSAGPTGATDEAESSGDADEADGSEGSEGSGSSGSGSDSDPDSDSDSDSESSGPAPTARATSGSSGSGSDGSDDAPDDAPSSGSGFDEPEEPDELDTSGSGGRDSGTDSTSGSGADGTSD